MRSAALATFTWALLGACTSPSAGGGAEQRLSRVELEPDPITRVHELTLEITLVSGEQVTSTQRVDDDFTGIEATVPSEPIQSVTLIGRDAAGCVVADGSSTADGDLIPPIPFFGRGEFQTLPKLGKSNELIGHTTTLLNDGTALVIGAEGFAQIFDPRTGTVSALPATGSSRGNHSAAMLPDGTVILAGGADSSSIDFFDSGTGTFQTIGALRKDPSENVSMQVPRPDRPAVGPTTTGEFLIAGGHAGTTPSPTEIVNISNRAVAAIRSESGLFLSSASSEPATVEGWIGTVGGEAARYQFTRDGIQVEQATLEHARVRPIVVPLSNPARVLVAGGLRASDANEFEPSIEILTLGSPLVAPDIAGTLDADAARATAVQIAADRIWILGGARSIDGVPQATSAIQEITVGASPSAQDLDLHLAQPRMDAQAVITSDGRIVVVGGQHGEAEVPLYELFVPPLPCGK